MKKKNLKSKQKSNFPPTGIYFWKLLTKLQRKLLAKLTKKVGFVLPHNRDFLTGWHPQKCSEAHFPGLNLAEAHIHQHCWAGESAF